ncbi:MAG: hypothetical protein V1709_06860 [Planctomycetota bacterium]
MLGKDKKIGLVQVKINGKLIPLKGFVQDFVGFTILGMLKSLRGTDNPKEVEIKIKLKQPRHSVSG